MKIGEFELQLDESKMGDIYERVRELRALNNSGTEIVTKVAKEFNKSYNSIEKLLLPKKLKSVDSLDEKEIKKLRRSYTDLFSKAELSKLSDKIFIKELKNKVIAKGGTKYENHPKNKWQRQ